MKKKINIEGLKKRYNTKKSQRNGLQISTEIK